MSISGVRTAYSAADVELITALLAADSAMSEGHPPRPDRAAEPIRDALGPLPRPGGSPAPLVLAHQQ